MSNVDRRGERRRTVGTLAAMLGFPVVAVTVLIVAIDAAAEERQRRRSARNP